MQPNISSIHQKLTADSAAFASRTDSQNVAEMDLPSFGMATCLLSTRIASEDTAYWISFANVPCELEAREEH